MQQLKLFDFQAPLKKDKKRKWPYVFHLIIMENDGSEYEIYQGGHSLAQAKKIAAIKYNSDKGFNKDKFVKFKKFYRKYVKTRKQQ